MALFENGYALLVGAGGDLPDTVTDVEGLVNILRDNARCAYPPDQVLTRTEAQADRGGVVQAFQDLAKASQPGGTCIVYFSGHGYRVSHPALGAQYYLMPNGYSAADLPGSAISGKEFAGMLAAIPAERLLVLLDCCHAGGVALEAPAKGDELTFAKAPLPEEALALLGEGSGRALVASSRASEKSYGGKPFSAFTLALFEALCGIGNSHEDGYVRVTDLAMYAAKMVPRRTQDRQNPVLHYEQADNFVLAYYAAGEKEPKGLPFETEAEIEPEPGAWRGWSLRVQTGDVQVINTGGGSYFGKVKKSKIIMGDQINRYEDRSIQVNAPTNNSILNTGDGNVINQANRVEVFLEQLDGLQNGLIQSDIPEKEQEELRRDLEEVEEEALKPEPNRARILSRLAGVVEFLANSATIIAASPQLVEMGRQLYESARLLFPG